MSTVFGKILDCKMLKDAFAYVQLCAEIKDST